MQITQTCFTKFGGKVARVQRMEEDSRLWW